jgi:hypothetical protein
MLEIKNLNKSNKKPQWIISMDKINQKKEYQKWRTRSRSYCMQTITKEKKAMHMNITYKNSRPQSKDQT